ncbi:hypothetical protein ABFX02_02G083900 [Erythranthe guttata]
MAFWRIALNSRNSINFISSSMADVAKPSLNNSSNYSKHYSHKITSPFRISIFTATSPPRRLRHGAAQAPPPSRALLRRTLFLDRGRGSRVPRPSFPFAAAHQHQHLEGRR